MYKLLPPQVAMPHHLRQCSQPFRAALGLGCSSVQSTCLACRRSWVQAPELPKRVGVADSFDELHTAWGYPEDDTVYTVCGLFPYLSGDSDSVSPSLRSHTTLEQQDSLVRPTWHICWWKPVLPGSIWKHRIGLNHSPVFRGHISLVTVEPQV